MKQKTPRAKCLNPAWRYVSAIDTDIGKRFRAEYKRLALEQQTPKVTQLRKVKS